MSTQQVQLALEAELRNHQGRETDLRQEISHLSEALTAAKLLNEQAVERDRLAKAEKKLLNTELETLKLALNTSQKEVELSNEELQTAEENFKKQILANRTTAQEVSLNTHHNPNNFKSPHNPNNLSLIHLFDSNHPEF